MYAQAVRKPPVPRRGRANNQVHLNSVQKGVHFQMSNLIVSSGRNTEMYRNQLLTGVKK